MARICHLCRHNFVKGDKVSMLRFPEDENLSKKWKDFYRITDADKIDHIYLCLKHFTKKNTVSCGTSGKKVLLKPEAPPTPTISPRSPQIKKVSTPQEDDVNVSSISKSDSPTDAPLCSSLIDHLYFRPPDDLENNENPQHALSTSTPLGPGEKNVSSLKKKRVSYRPLSMMGKIQASNDAKFNRSLAMRKSYPLWKKQKPDELLKNKTNKEKLDDRKFRQLAVRKSYTLWNKPKPDELLDNNANNEKPDATEVKGSPYGGRRLLLPKEKQELHQKLRNNIFNAKPDMQVNRSQTEVQKFYIPRKKREDDQLLENDAIDKEPDDTRIEHTQPEPKTLLSPSEKKEVHQLKDNNVINENQNDSKTKHTSPERKKLYTPKKKLNLDKSLDNNSINEDPTAAQKKSTQSHGKKSYTPRKKRKTEEPLDNNANKGSPGNTPTKNNQLDEKKVCSPVTDEDTYVLLENILDDENLESIKAKLNQPAVETLTRTSKQKHIVLWEATEDDKNQTDLQSELSESEERKVRSTRKRRKFSDDPDYVPPELIEPEEGKRYALRKRRTINESMNNTENRDGPKSKSTQRKRNKPRFVRKTRKSINSLDDTVHDEIQSKPAQKAASMEKVSTPKMNNKNSEPEDIFAIDRDLDDTRFESFEPEGQHTSNSMTNEKHCLSVDVFANHLGLNNKKAALIQLEKGKWSIPDKKINRVFDLEAVFGNSKSPETKEEISCTPKKDRVHEPEDIFADSESLVVKKSEPTQPVENDLEFFAPEKKRLVFEPRYIAEITTMDFNTPSSARRTINFVQRKDAEKSKKIDNLQHQVRRLKGCVTSLKGILKHLDQQGLIKVQPEDTVTEMETYV